MTPSQPPLIAVSDDNGYLVDLLELRFRAERWRTARFEATDVVSRLLTEDVAALVLDIEMPGANGLDILADIRRYPWIADIPVIMLTGRRKPRDIETAKSLGAAAYVVKPFDIEALTRRVHRHLPAATASATAPAAADAFMLDVD